MASLAPVEGSAVLEGVAKYAFTQLQKHSNSFDCPDCLCGASLVSDGEVLRLAEFGRSGPTCSIEWLDIGVRPYSTTSACGIRDNSGNNFSAGAADGCH